MTIALIFVAGGIGLLAVQYLLVQGLRLRFKTFWGDAIICALLFVAFVTIWRAQATMDEVERSLVEARKVHDARAIEHS